MRSTVILLDAIRSFLQDLSAPLRAVPERTLITLAAVQSHADRCGMDAMLRASCRPCGRDTLHTIMPDGGYQCLPELTAATDDRLASLLDCLACGRATAHLARPGDGDRCVPCWMRQAWKLARDAGTPIEDAVDRLRRFSQHAGVPRLRGSAVGRS